MSKRVIEWEINSDLSKQTLSIKQGFFGVLFCVFLIYLFVISLEVFDSYSSLTMDSFLAITKVFFYFALVTIIVLGITFALFFRNYQYRYVINEKGIMSTSGKKQYRKNTILNNLLVILALFSRNPSVAGAGLIAQSTQSIFVEWADIHEIEPIPKKHIINLKNKWRTIIDIHCTPDNYHEVLSIIKSQIQKP